MSEQYQQLINLVVAEGKVDLETATIRINSVSIEEVELGLSWFSHRAEFNSDVFPPFFLADLVKRVDNYLNTLGSNKGYGFF